MTNPLNLKWPLGTLPCISLPLPQRMEALVIRRDQYGPPDRWLRLEEVPAPRLCAEDGGRVLVAVLASLQPAWKASRMDPITALRHV